MKGERTLKDKPFRFGGIEHDFDKDAEEWAKDIGIEEENEQNEEFINERRRKENDKVASFCG